MKRYNKLISVCLLGAALLGFASCANSSQYTEAKITGIKFNSKDATAVIDESTKKNYDFIQGWN